MASQDLLNRLTIAEDTARVVRNSLAGATTHEAIQVRALADAMAQGLQAVREILQETRKN